MDGVERRPQISSNGLARLLSLEFLIGFCISSVIAAFAVGVAYSDINRSLDSQSTTIKSVGAELREKNSKQDARIDALEQARLESSIVQATTAEALRGMATSQNDMKRDINRIIDILESRR